MFELSLSSSFFLWKQFKLAPLLSIIRYKCLQMSFKIKNNLDSPSLMLHAPQMFANVCFKHENFLKASSIATTLLPTKLAAEVVEHVTTFHNFVFST